MDTFKILSPLWLIGLALLSASVLHLAVNKSKRNALIGRVRLRNRRAPTAGTPPRSLSPEKKSSTSQPSQPSYTDILPPQRREVLPKLVSSLSYDEVSEDEVKRRILPMATDYRTSKGNRYTPTGFSVDEIKALGDFPDYAELSGVPLPQAYPEFNIDKALSRLYRPFRWVYHQTMCTFLRYTSRESDELCRANFVSFINSPLQDGNGLVDRAR